MQLFFGLRPPENSLSSKTKVIRYHVPPSLISCTLVRSLSLQESFVIECRGGSMLFDYSKNVAGNPWCKILPAVPSRFACVIFLSLPSFLLFILSPWRPVRNLVPSCFNCHSENQWLGTIYRAVDKVIRRSVLRRINTSNLIIILTCITIAFANKNIIFQFFTL